MNQRGRSGLGSSAQGRTFGGSNNTQNQRQVASVQLNESTSITADPATNTLIIQSNKADYEKIRSLIDNLDIKRRQVLVEAMLLEVSVDTSQTLGFDFMTSTGGSDGGVLAQSLGGADGLPGLLRDPRLISGFSIAAASSGSLKLPGDIVIPTQSVMLSAAQSNQNVNVLSAPTLLATDNEPAEIVVGQNVPFLASTSTNETNLNNTFNQIDRQDVGITLRLTPQISSEDFVTNVSDLVPTAETQLGPTTTVRSSETTVITRDGQMIVIGGLMADQNNDADSGVPFFKDIPIFGAIFQRSTERRVRTNLLTFITPHIVKDQFDARDQTLGQRDKVQDVIREVGSRPDRSDVLDNPSFDNVSEVEKGDVVSPGTIKGPGSNRSNSDVMNKGENLEQSRETTHEAQLAPRLLGAKRISSAQAKNYGVNNNLVNSARASYLVLKIISGRPSNDSIIKDRDGLVALKLPEGTPDDAKSFFSLGKRVVFDDDDGPVVLEVSERHPTPASAGKGKNFRPTDWRALTAFELMRLGAGPWRPATKKGDL
jgi:Flp pilus assembly secretin CpaC